MPNFNRLVDSYIREKIGGKSLSKYLVTFFTLSSFSLLGMGCGSAVKKHAYNLNPLKNQHIKEKNVNMEKYIENLLDKRKSKGEVLQEPITEKNFLTIALRNNPDIHAGKDVSEYLRLISLYNDIQYTPKFKINHNIKFNFDSDTNLERKVGLITEASISQKFKSGFSGKIFATYEEFEDDRITSGAEIEFFIPGISSTIADQKVEDLRKLQEPAKREADFVSTMRSTLDDIIWTFYSTYRWANEELEVEKDVKYNFLLKIMNVLESRIEAKGEDSSTQSDIDLLKSLIENSKNSIENNLPAYIRKSRKDLLSSLGVSDAEINYKDLEFKKIELDYEFALEAVLKKDPLIKGYWMELNIAEVEIGAAKKNLDVKLIGGIKNVYDDGHSETDKYVGLSATYSLDFLNLFKGGPNGKDILIKGLKAKKRVYEKKIEGAVINLMNETYDLYESIRENGENIDNASQEKVRKQMAFWKIFKSFEKGEKWADLNRVNGLLNEWVNSEIKFFESKREYERDVQRLYVKIGKYDQTKSKSD